MKVELISFDRNKGKSCLQEIDISCFYSVKFLTGTGKQFEITFVDEGNNICVREVSALSSRLVVQLEANNSIIIK